MDTLDLLVDQSTDFVLRVLTVSRIKSTDYTQSNLIFVVTSRFSRLISLILKLPPVKDESYITCIDSRGKSQTEQCPRFYFKTQDEEIKRE